MKRMAFLVVLAVIGFIAFAWLGTNSFREVENRETKAARMEQEIRNIQRDYNVDYTEALAIFNRRHRER